MTVSYGGRRSARFAAGAGSGGQRIAADSEYLELPSAEIRINFGGSSSCNTAGNMASEKSRSGVLS
jgi:hypothetical protein